MVSFEKAVNYTLYWEGGLDNDPDDPGGVTNFGIILPILKQMGLAGDFNHDGDVTAEDIKMMTREQAVEVYRVQWWDRYQYSKLISQFITTKLMDTSVNLGPSQAGKIFQRAANTVNQILGYGYVPLLVDGIIGFKTYEFLNKFHGNLSSYSLRCSLASEQAAIYRMICQIHPTSQKFLKGWLRRAYSFPERIVELGL